MEESSSRVPGYFQGLVQILQSQPEVSSMQGAPILSGAAHVIRPTWDGVC
jgi:hypothetical protein